MIKRVSVFTGSRGEWGYLRPVLEQFQSNSIDFEIIASNMHTSIRHGNSSKEIEKDGFKVNHKIYMNIEGPDNLVWSKSLGLLQLQLADILYNYNPDILLIAGDRAETFMAAITAFYNDTLIAHIQAGERSGHKDGMVRHAIGKLAHIHFASNKDAFNRLKHFGEQEFRIYNTGAPQLDDMVNSTPLEPTKLASSIIKNNPDYALCIVHPTSENSKACENYVELVHHSLNMREIHQVWILPNNDSGSDAIYDLITNLPSENVTRFRNLNRADYLSLLKNCKVIIGNSSSGILEASTFKTPSINLGERQNDRISSDSVIHIKEPNLERMTDALKRIDSIQFKELLSEVENPYGDGNSAARILKILKNIDINDRLLRNKTVTI